MWVKWLHTPALRNQGRPLCWWQQLETSQRGDLPFAHLFPQPPTGRRRNQTETQRLVAQLVESRAREPGLEATVQAHVEFRNTQGWDPVEPWQILDIGRIDPSEAEKWGPDGLQVLEWFDRGELSVWPMDAQSAPIPPRAGPVQRIIARVRRLLAPPPRMAGAEC